MYSVYTGYLMSRCQCSTKSGQQCSRPPIKIKSKPGDQLMYCRQHQNCLTIGFDGFDGFSIRAKRCPLRINPNWHQAYWVFRMTNYKKFSLTWAPTGLGSIGLVSKHLRHFCDKYLRGILLMRLRFSGFDLKKFATPELGYLYQVLSVPHEMPMSHWIDHQGQVYAWGYGRLGLGDTDNRSTPALIESFGKVIQVYDRSIYIVINQPSSSSSLFLTDQNQVYACGQGVGETPTRLTTRGNVEIVQMSSGRAHRLFLTSIGQVYVSGSGSYGELGLGSKIRTAKFTLIPHLFQTIQISGKGHHSLFLTCSGHVAQIVLAH